VLRAGMSANVAIDTGARPHGATVEAKTAQR
jgi:hypothetical protein